MKAENEMKQFWETSEPREPYIMELMSHGFSQQEAIKLAAVKQIPSEADDINLNRLRFGRFLYEKGIVNEGFEQE